MILGQDPYHGAGQAEGLSFSVPPGTRVPPSLRNIFKEIGTDLGLPTAANGHLGHWARRGVLLLNTTLTVEAGRAGSHRRHGWEEFTDSLIGALAATGRPLVFLLWGNDARKKAEFVAAPRHLVLTAPHPSPLSAYQGFLGCRHFSKANAFLAANGLPPIDWRPDPSQ